MGVAIVQRAALFVVFVLLAAVALAQLEYNPDRPWQVRRVKSLANHRAFAGSVLWPVDRRRQHRRRLLTRRAA